MDVVRRDMVILACGDGDIEQRLREALEAPGKRANGRCGAHERTIKIVSVCSRIDANRTLDASGSRVAAIICDDRWSGEHCCRGWSLLHEASLRVPLAYRAMIAEDGQRELELRTAGGQTWPRDRLAASIAGIGMRALIRMPCALCAGDRGCRTGGKCRLRNPGGRVRRLLFAVPRTQGRRAADGHRR